MRENGRRDADPDLPRLAAGVPELQRDGAGKGEPRGDGALSRGGSGAGRDPGERHLRGAHPHPRRLRHLRLPQAPRPRAGGRAAPAQRLHRRRWATRPRSCAPISRRGSPERSPAWMRATTSSGRPVSDPPVRGRTPPVRSPSDTPHRAGLRARLRGGCPPPRMPGGFHRDPDRGEYAARPEPRAESVSGYSTDPSPGSDRPAHALDRLAGGGVSRSAGPHRVVDRGDGVLLPGRTQPGERKKAVPHHGELHRRRAGPSGSPIAPPPLPSRTGSSSSGTRSPACTAAGSIPPTC